MWVSVVALLMASTLIVLHAFEMSTNQRDDVCQAVLVSLDVSVRNATAGIRPVEPLSSVAGLPPELRRAFARQRAGTIRENQRRAVSAGRAAQARADLASSDFCQQ
jgi:Flp pilus assembly protein TadB